MKKSFIDEHRHEYGVEPICRVLQIAPSIYREHAARKADPSRAPARVQRDAWLRMQIRRVWEESFQLYGIRKVWHQLRREGIRVAHLVLDVLEQALYASRLECTLSPSLGPGQPIPVYLLYQAP